MERDPSSRASDSLVEISPDRFMAELDAVRHATDAEQVAQDRLDDELLRDDSLFRYDVHRRTQLMASETAGKRRVTDPYSREPDDRPPIAFPDSDTPSFEPIDRPRESISMKWSGTLRLLGRFARKNTVNAREYNGRNVDRTSERDPILSHRTEKIAAEENKWLSERTPRTEADVATKGLFSAIRSILAERRIAKQKLRQDRSKFAEKMYGTSIGEGKQAFWGTKLKRFSIWKDANKRFLNGEITAADRRSMIKTWTPHTPAEIKGMQNRVDSGEMKKAEFSEQVGQFGRVITSPTAVRRQVRHERAGAAYSHVRAKRPVSSAYRKHKARKAEALAQETMQARQARERLLADLASLNDKRIRESEDASRDHS
jgi:hypothetical protein